MKRPLVVITAGFVLGEVLTLCLQEAVYKRFFWLVGVLFWAVLLVRCFLQVNQSRSVIYRTVLLFFVLFFGGMTAGSFIGAQCRRGMEEEEKMIFQAELGQVVQITGKVVDVREKNEKLEIIVNRVKVQKKTQKVRENQNRDDPVEALWLPLQFPVQLYGTPGDLEGWEEKLLPGKQVKIACFLSLTEPAKNPGEFDPKLYYRSKGVLCTGSIKALKESSGADRPFMRLVLWFRRYCSRILDQYCEKEDSGIYKAVLLGDTSFMENETMDLYRSSGIAHLLAVSGQHLSLIGGGLYLLLRKTIGGFRAAGILGGSFVISYGIFTGSSGSALRAVFMICCLWLAAERGRTYDSLSALSFAAVSLLWKNPYLIFHSGFQLSFAAVFAISGPGQWMIREYNIGKNWEKTAVISLWVQIVLLPVMAWHYYQYPLYGMFLNFLVLPLVPFLMISGILILLTGGFWPFVAEIAVKVGHVILLYYKWICGCSLKLPGAQLILGRPGMGQILGYIVLWGITVAVLRWFVNRQVVSKIQSPKQNRAEKRRLNRTQGRCKGQIRNFAKKLAGPVLPAAVLLVSLICSFLILSPRPVKGCELFCLDVGQGDGFLLRSGKTNILIDGGSSDQKKLGSRTLEPCLRSKGITRLDIAIVSHGDNDHISGLLYLLQQKMPINLLILPAGGRGGDIYEKLEQLQTENGGITYYMHQGEKIKAGEMEFTCIFEKETEEERNAHSLVLCTHYKDLHMLFTGDMGIAEETELLKLAETKGSIQQEHLRHVQILKTAHHGSKGSSTPAFLEAMPLQAAFISYGKDNSYGHPAPQVTEEMKKRNISLYETGGNGAWTLENKSGNVIIKRAVKSITEN